MLAECSHLDIQGLINQLKSSGHNWKLIEICPIGDIRLLAKQSVSISVVKEEKHYSCYKLIDKGVTHMLFTVHLISGMYKNEDARSQRACNTSVVLQKIEQDVFAGQELKSIIVGDFNLQPYSQGIAGAFGFNATMSIAKAKQKYRIVDDVKCNFYYNPIWDIMGSNNLVQGTYYNNNDETDLSIFWYSYDSVLLRPYFIDKFVWDSFKIIEESSSFKFIKSHKIDNDNFSDHLPIKFEIKEGGN
ncbi:hypothetical protein LY85_0846 [Clostridium sp. KNHs216]|nr:hypothetical protein LY85_0846 [Clostridium sp. KNHs216]